MYEDLPNEVKRYEILPFLDDKTLCKFIIACRKFYEWGLEERKRRLNLPFSYTKTLMPCKSEVSCLVVYNNQLISGDLVGTIKIWDLKTWKCIKTLIGHEYRISCLVVHNNQLISKDCGGTIKIWDLNSYRYAKTLAEHGNNAGCLVVYNNQLISGDLGGTIRIWDLKTWKCVRTLIGLLEGVSCLIVYNNQLISLKHMSKTIKIWDLKTWKGVKIITGYVRDINCLIVHNNQLISGDSGGSIKILDLKTWKYVRTVTRHTDEISCLVGHNNKLISGDSGGSVRIWDLKTWRCVKIPNEHTGKVSCLVVCNNRLISGSWDNTIKIQSQTVFPNDDIKLLFEIATKLFENMKYNDIFHLRDNIQHLLNILKNTDLNHYKRLQKFSQEFQNIESQYNAQENFYKKIARETLDTTFTDEFCDILEKIINNHKLQEKSDAFKLYNAISIEYFIKITKVVLRDAGICCWTKTKK